MSRGFFEANCLHNWQYVGSSMWVYISIDAQFKKFYQLQGNRKLIYGNRNFRITKFADRQDVKKSYEEFTK